MRSELEHTLRDLEVWSSAGYSATRCCIVTGFQLVSVSLCVSQLQKVFCAELAFYDLAAAAGTAAADEDEEEEEADELDLLSSPASFLWNRRRNSS